MINYWSHLLFVAYFVAVVAAMGKATRYAIDARRKKEWFYWIGVPANLALAGALLLIAVSTGEDPYWRGEWLRTAVRGAFILWAALASIFEVCYFSTFLRIDRNGGNGDGRDDVESTGNSGYVGFGWRIHRAEMGRHGTRGTAGLY